MSYLDDEYDEEYEIKVMSGAVDELKNSVIGRRIVKVNQEKNPEEEWGMPYGRSNSIRLTLDNGESVFIDDTYDCCAYTEVESFKFLENVDNVITSVEADKGFEKWFIYADQIPVVEMDVSWSPGNPYYYGFGLSIRVEKEGA